MCGILGAFGQRAPQYYQDRFAYALDLLRHRGPDYRQIWNNQTVILGHQRLAIVELSSASHQPMQDHSSRYRIIFNGEIYNYQEIREELKRNGSHFLTQSDTEVILEAYKTWGEKCFGRFNGMWALAIYDSKNNEMLLSRDRYGVKPLYYAVHDGNVLFASEMKALLALGVNSSANWKQISRFLQGWGCDSGEDTVFNDIHALPAGHFMKISSSGLIKTKWWDIHSNRVDVPGTFEERVKYFQDIFEDSVRLRLRNDVDTGVCLSGGMDSSSVYGAARKLQKNHAVRSATGSKEKNFRIFSVSHPSHPLDEYPWVDKCLKFWDDHDKVSVVSPQPNMFPELIDEVIWHQEAPVWSASVFAFHALYRHIASLGTKVILEGHGADELLGGYPYLVKTAVQSYAGKGNIKSAWEASQCLIDTKNPNAQDARMPVWFPFLSAFICPGLLSPPPRLLKFKRRLGKNMRLSYFDADVIDDHLSVNKIKVEDHNKLNQELFTAFTEKILPIELRVFDRASMAYGVESRSPFLDYRIVQFLFSSIEEDKVLRVNKRILRSAAESWIPQSVIERKAKLGFSLPEADWFNAPVVKGYLRDIFNSQDAVQSNLFDGKSFSRDLDKCFQKGFSWEDAASTWEVLNIHLWHKKFSEEIEQKVPINS